jgi:trehalose 6-phosphate phosphatase
MRHALAAASRAELRARLGKDAVLVFDYDGTLAPIVADPERAFMAEHTRALLAALTVRARCVLLTGRSLAQTQRFLPSIDFVLRIGNHGAEWSTGAHPFAGVSSAQRAQVVAAAEATPRAVVEDKGYSLSVHTRAVEREADCEVLAARLAAISGVKIIPGKRVLNVLAEDAPDKGRAVLALHDDLGGPAMLFVGDDVTDETVFALERSWLVGVRVQEQPGSKAAYYLESQSEMDALLAWLLTLYPEGPPRG